MNAERIEFDEIMMHKVIDDLIAETRYEMYCAWVVLMRIFTMEIRKTTKCPCCGVRLITIIHHQTSNSFECDVKIQPKEKDWRKLLEEQMKMSRTESDGRKCWECAYHGNDGEDPICLNCIKTVTHEYTRHLNFKPQEETMSGTHD